MDESPYEYFARQDVVAEYASFDFLLDPERILLEELRPTLGQASMLDIGVGAGRTTIHFAKLTREYVGVDSSAEMIRACEKRFHTRTDGRVSFLQADVRFLDALASNSFDVVLFSFNGLDIVGDHEDRLQALREIHRVCKGGAVYCFSSHNMGYVPIAFSIRASLRRLFAAPAVRQHKRVLLRHPRMVFESIARPLRWRRLNDSHRTLQGKGHAIIVEERPRYEFSRKFYTSPDERIRVRMYYIDPREQIRQLEQAGFAGVRVFSKTGVDVTDRVQDGLTDWWLYYMCVKQPQTRTDSRTEEQPGVP